MDILISVLLIEMALDLPVSCDDIRNFWNRKVRKMSRNDKRVCLEGVILRINILKMVIIGDSKVEGVHMRLGQ